MTSITLGKYAALATLVLSVLPAMQGCSMQRRFDTPDAAVDALVKSFRDHDTKATEEILGKESESLLFSGDPVADKANLEIFLNSYDQKHTLVPLDDDTMQLNIGKDDWPMPIPVARDDFWKKWYFDTEEGKQEILNRRIGRNELDTMQTCLAIVDAQDEYAETDPQNTGLPVYAQKFLSDPGTKDGLYWPTTEDENPSPLGLLAAEAESYGYHARTAEQRAKEGARPYHGYYFKILTAQGPAAKGGARNYIVDGKLLGGFAVIAYPATYGNSGVMTFITNQDGTLYQRDLGPDTAKLAPAITEFNPDSTWTVTSPPKDDDSPATQPAK